MKAVYAALILIVTGCTAGPYPGPDKQFAGGLQGAATGAGAGAITGFQIGAGSGPGAVVGAGLGAVAGSIQGAMADGAEERGIEISQGTSEERSRAAVHEILQDHYVRRMQLHPSRDIYPADLFFNGDDVRLCGSGISLVEEIANLSKHRMPWSRFVVTSYVRSKGSDFPYAKYLAESRAKEITTYLVRNGIEPRRLLSRGVVVDAPLLLDPYDHPDRYSQAIELATADR